MHSYSAPRFLPCGDAGLTVEFGDEIDPALNAAVTALDAALADAPPVGLIECVPTYRSLTLLFDPAQTDHAQIQAAITARLGAARADPPPSPIQWRIPVLYGGAGGFDLLDAAAATGLSPEMLIARHTAPRYRVYMLGFMPGFAYLGGLDPSLTLPRMANPRLQVPAGSVIIAGRQAGVTPVAMPCGWYVLGHTPLTLFDPALIPPVRLSAGAELRFVAIDAATHAALSADPQACLRFAEAAA